MTTCGVKKYGILGPSSNYLLHQVHFLQAKIASQQFSVKFYNGTYSDILILSCLLLHNFWSNNKPQLLLKSCSKYPCQVQSFWSFELLFFFRILKTQSDLNKSILNFQPTLYFAWTAWCKWSDSKLCAWPRLLPLHRCSTFYLSRTLSCQLSSKLTPLLL